MRIAQIAPLWEQVPPPAYGGTELIVSLLTEELVHRGHQVTLFATGDSQTRALLKPGCEQALRPQRALPSAYAGYEQSQLNRVFNLAAGFDLIHSHIGEATLPYAKCCSTLVVHTLHGPFTPATERLFSQYRGQNLISVSNSQQRPDLALNYVATVYNAIATETFKFYPQPSQPPYLAFLGRMSPEKGPQLAIKIAKRGGWPLKMAGKIDFENQDFFDQEIAPHIDDQQIQFLGEVTHRQKNQLMGNASATLFPITWPEPFGLVMTESMASGTPVIAMAIGAAPEIIVDRQTGFLCQTLEDCLAAVAQIPQIDRQTCRDHVSVNFGMKRMVDDYEVVYRRLLCEHLLHKKRPPHRILASNSAAAAAAALTQLSTPAMAPSRQPPL
ncbi:MAG: glycosyltransferase family 4 protein [Leptolyngbya sp. DLM2.Bin15]|nr:MAG: glycosyltransferase family 4 protein [Leptolyngbya sp. DLM2.Bin15]